MTECVICRNLQPADCPGCGEQDQVDNPIECQDCPGDENCCLVDPFEQVLA